MFKELNETELAEMPHPFETVSPEYTDIPDPEHFDTICEGALDTLEGMESMSTTYTKAQAYLFSCMSAADHIDYKQQRSGMEGVFSAIGDGLGAVWDFIKKVFNAVWRAFFGGGDDSITSKAGKTGEKVKENKAVMEKDDKPGKPVEEVEKQRKKAKEKANKVINNPKASSADKAVAQQITKTIDEGNVKSPSQKEQDLKKVKENYFKIDKDVREFIIKSVGEAENQRKKYVEYISKDSSNDIKAARWKSTYQTFKVAIDAKIVAHKISDVVKVDSITTVAKGLDVQTQLMQLLNVHEQIAKAIATEKGDLEHEIKQLEEAIRKKGKGSTKGDVLGEKYNTKDEVRDRLASAKVVLSIVNATAGYQTKLFQMIERLSAQIKDHFCPFM